jgi:hypothetical protein
LKQYRKIIRAITPVLESKQWKTPILVHGYAYPLPAYGRALNNPDWIQKPFFNAGYQVVVSGVPAFDKDAATQNMKVLIDALNEEVFKVLEKEFPGRVVYVNLRKIATDEDHWGNDMHLTEDKFAEAAGEVHKAIKTFWASQTP